MTKDPNQLELLKYFKHVVKHMLDFSPDLNRLSQ